MSLKELLKNKDEEYLLKLINLIYKIEKEQEYTVYFIKDETVYRLYNKNNIFILKEGYSPRVYMPLTYKKVKESSNIDDIYLYLLKKYEESTKYMKNRKSITELYIKLHLNKDDEFRGKASVIDTGLFDFKIK